MFLKLIITLGLLLFLSGCSGGSYPKKGDKRSEIVQELTPTQKDVVRVHNKKRRNYFNDSDLIYSMKLEKDAQKYADILANSGKFEHDPQNGVDGYGENLYARSQQVALTISDAMPHWYDDEKPLYKYSDGSCKESYYENGNRVSCGHYTQVIWQDTTEVGCATSQYRRGEMKNGFIYVCKYKKAGNSSIYWKKLKPYCTEYSRRDLYIGDPPSFRDIRLAGKRFPIELVVEDRVRCLRKDNYNSAIEFGSNLKRVKVKNFQIFNDGAYPNSLEFDRVEIDGKEMILRGKNRNIGDKRYRDRNIYMRLKLIGETRDYYAVEIEWNGIDENLAPYAREMRAKLYK